MFITAFTSARHLSYPEINVHAFYLFFKFFLLRLKGNFSLNQFHIIVNKT